MNIFRLATIGLGAAALSACTTTSDHHAQSTPVSAPTENVVENSSVQVVQIDTDRVVCKKKTLTGSRFGKKVCMTVGQWSDMEKNAKNTTQYLQNRGLRTNQALSN